MSNFAIIRTGGKQYKVSPGTKLKLDRLKEGLPSVAFLPAVASAEAGVKEGNEVVFDEVLLLHKNKKTEVGTPLVAGAAVIGKIFNQGRGKKIVVFHYRPKTRYRKKAGHRQPFTEVVIEKIVA